MLVDVGHGIEVIDLHMAEEVLQGRCGLLPTLRQPGRLVRGETPGSAADRRAAGGTVDRGGSVSIRRIGQCAGRNVSCVDTVRGSNGS